MVSTEGLKVHCLMSSSYLSKPRLQKPHAKISVIYWVFRNIWWNNERMLWKIWILSTQKYYGGGGGKHKTKTCGLNSYLKLKTNTPLWWFKGYLFTPFLCIGVFNEVQRSSSNKCCSHGISEIYLATVHPSSQAFGQCLRTASLALKHLWRSFWCALRLKSQG